MTRNPGLWIPDDPFVKGLGNLRDDKLRYMILSFRKTWVNNFGDFLFETGEKLFFASERVRIRLHLWRTERVLRKTNVSHLTPALQQRRLQHLDCLHEYWDRGDFPINTDFPDRRMPYIRDRFGTLCAMAYIIWKDGNEDLVNVLERTDNNVFINDVKDGPLVDWLKTSGLTQKEAARIQPTYPPCPECIFYVLLRWIILLGIIWIPFHIFLWKKVKRLNLLPSSAIFKVLIYIGLLLFSILVTIGVLLMIFYPTEVFDEIYQYVIRP